MDKQVNIQQLVKLAGAGDTGAFGELYDIYLDALYRFVSVRVGSRADAEDITEQIFVSMFTAINRYTDEGLPFEAWMYRIARNKVIDYYRGRKPHVRLDEIAEVPDSRETPEVQTEKSLTREAVLRCLTRIAPTYQEIIILKYIEDKTNEEISIILEKPVAHVRVLQHRAIEALRNIVQYE
jgi:RNA polymerase sigma-70 factor (ECF subfamily)